MKDRIGLGVDLLGDDGHEEGREARHHSMVDDNHQSCHGSPTGEKKRELKETAIHFASLTHISLPVDSGSHTTLGRYGE
jgi:hypothetical protein